MENEKNIKRNKEENNKKCYNAKFDRVKRAQVDETKTKSDRLKGACPNRRRRDDNTNNFLFLLRSLSLALYEKHQPHHHRTKVFGKTSVPLPPAPHAQAATRTQNNRTKEVDEAAERER